MPEAYAGQFVGRVSVINKEIEIELKFHEAGGKQLQECLVSNREVLKVCQKSQVNKRVVVRLAGIR